MTRRRRRPAHQLTAVLALSCAMAVACGGPGPGQTTSADPSAGTATPRPGVDLQATGPADVPPDLLAPASDEAGAVPAPDTTPVRTGSLRLGDRTPLAADAPELAIAFPDGTAAGVTMEVAPVVGMLGDGYGGLVAPASSLYTVNGAEELAEPVLVTVALPPGHRGDARHLPMLMYYDEVTGVLTPLTPAVAPDKTHVSGIAPHFSSVLAVLVDLAKVPAVADSGFRPGTDDWQFTNYGSYAAPGGHCEGQVMSEMWYYAVQRRGAGASPLNGLYDNNGATERTTKLWQDDSHGYRLASTVQHDPFTDPFTRGFFRTLGREQVPSLAGVALRLAIALSGRPQYVSIGDRNGEHGHALAAYRVTEDRIFVADPNYPGRLRTIRLRNDGTPMPYSSGDSAATIAAQGAVSYVKVAYVPFASMKSDATIAAHWAEFEAGTIGSTAFPVTTLLALEVADGVKRWVPLVDGYVAQGEKLTVGLDVLSDSAPASMLVYAGASETPLDDWNWKHEITLQPGDNPLGFYVMGNGAEGWRYVDFIRLTVRQGAAPTASPTTAPVAGGGAILASFDGPTTWTGSSPETATFTVKVSGGTAPYHYTWSARGTQLGQADGGASFSFSLTSKQMGLAGNGGGYYVSLFVTDASGAGLRWVDDTGRPNSEFIYAIENVDSVDGIKQEVRHYPAFPYKSPPN